MLSFLCKIFKKGAIFMPEKNGQESKSDRFKRIASRRTQNVLEALRKLGNCSNKGIYQYNNDDIEKIFHAIESDIKRVKVLFNPKSSSNKFSL